MNLKQRNRVGLALFLVVAALVALVLNGCSSRDLTELELATAAANPVVFSDAFENGLDYSAFLDSYYESLTIDEADTYAGTHSLKFTIPAGLWAGGSFWVHGPRDLSSFNALTFYAKANQTVEINEVGFGIPIVVPETYKATTKNITLGTEWQQYIVPIPDASKLTLEQGLFWFSDDGSASSVVEFWVDEVEFADLSGISNMRPSMDSSAVEALQGETVPFPEGETTFNVNGEDITVFHTPSYFTFFSSDENVATGGAGSSTAVNGGTATLTAELAGVSVEGEIAVTVIGPPSDPAATPTSEPGDVISIFSDEYDDITVDSWRATWSTSGLVYDQTIGGDNVKAYTSLSSRFVGIEFIANQIDATAAGMTHFHMDVYAPEGSIFSLKLVDFGPNGVYDGPGSDDTEQGIAFSSVSNPPFVTGQWVSLDIPLTRFGDMNFSNVAQLVMTGTVRNVWVDNIYFRK